MMGNQKNNSNKHFAVKKQNLGTKPNLLFIKIQPNKGRKVKSRYPIAFSFHSVYIHWFKIPHLSMHVLP